MSLASACAMAYTVTTAHRKRLGADEELCEKCLPGMELPLWYFRVLSTDRYNIFSQMARDISARIHKGRLCRFPVKCRVFMDSRLNAAPFRCGIGLAVCAARAERSIYER